MTALPQTFDDLHLGWKHSLRRTITQADMEQVIRVTGDQGGYHVDDDFARAAGFRTLITPGLLQAGMLTEIGGRLNFLAREMRFQFTNPVYVGDTLEACVEVTALDPGKELVTMSAQVSNQDGAAVLQAEIRGYMPRRAWGTPRKPPPVRLP